MTLEEFRATRQDWALDHVDESEDGLQIPVPGNTYTAGGHELYIYLEHREDEVDLWHLTLGNAQFESENLYELERLLYDWAVLEGYMENIT